MSYVDLRDFFEEYNLERDGFTIQVEKSGGGTIGKMYDGTWRYIVSLNGVEQTRGQDYHTGTPHTHEWVANDIYDWMNEE